MSCFPHIVSCRFVPCWACWESSRVGSCRVARVERVERVGQVACPCLACWLVVRVWRAVGVFGLGLLCVFAVLGFSEN